MPIISVPHLDKIECHGFPYACSIGFHDYEQNIKQTLNLDLDIFVKPLVNAANDDEKAIRFDYFEADLKLKQLLSDRKFKLIETVAEVVARFILSEFDIEAIAVRVHKNPLKMAPGQSVSYSCYREK